jgi:Fe/S biogenesis protein NfuA
MTKEISITVTKRAQEALIDAAEASDDFTHVLARIAIAGRTKGAFDYNFELLEPEDVSGDDQKIDFGDIVIYIDGPSLEYLCGATIDYAEDDHGEGGFHVDNPNPLWRDETHTKLQELLDTNINPALASHGGAIELLNITDNNAYIRMLGGCHGCGSATATIKNGVEVMIREAMPEIEQIIDHTDHTTGVNPYA